MSVQSYNTIGRCFALCHLLFSILLAAGQGKVSIALGMQLSQCSVLGSLLTWFPSFLERIQQFISRS